MTDAEANLPERLEALAQELHEWLWEEPCSTERDKGVAVGWEDATLWAARRIREVLWGEGGRCPDCGSHRTTFCNVDGMSYCDEHYPEGLR